MKENDLVYLRHIVEAIDKIENYLGDVAYQEFTQNDMMVDAVVRELEIIGEAAGSLSDDFKKEHPQFPLRESADMRNFLMHEYFGVIWDTCKVDLPELRKWVKELIQLK